MPSIIALPWKMRCFFGKRVRKRHGRKESFSVQYGHAHRQTYRAAWLRSELRNRLFFAARNLAIEALLLRLENRLLREGFPVRCEWNETSFGSPSIVLQLPLRAPSNSEDDDSDNLWVVRSVRVAREKPWNGSRTCATNRCWAAAYRSTATGYRPGESRARHQRWQPRHRCRRSAMDPSAGRASPGRSSRYGAMPVSQL